MATVARYALLVLTLLAPVLGPFPSVADAPDAGPVEASLERDDADGTDAADAADAVIAESSRPQSCPIRGRQRVHDADAPEGPPLQLADRPPSG